MPPGVFRSGARLAGQQLPGLVRKIKASIDEGVDVMKEAFSADDTKPHYPPTRSTDEERYRGVTISNAGPGVAYLIIEIDGATCSACGQPAAPEDHSHRLIVGPDVNVAKGCGVRFVGVTSLFLDKAALTIERRRAMQEDLPIVGYPRE